MVNITTVRSEKNLLNITDTGNNINSNIVSLFNLLEFIKFIV